MPQLEASFSIKPQIKDQLLKDKILLNLDWAKNQKSKTLVRKTVAFANKGSINSHNDKIMARMDDMTMQMNAQYKEMKSHTECNHCREKRTNEDKDKDRDDELDNVKTDGA
nr:reverse transcriptase domain-containing protein [Tanacetum cinerariifolium]GEY13044.1 reverse transcriptase domain-containing protein [Tanacetum cinerariifolium]